MQCSVVNPGVVQKAEPHPRAHSVKYLNIQDQDSSHDVISCRKVLPPGEWTWSIYRQWYSSGSIVHSCFLITVFYYFTILLPSDIFCKCMYAEVLVVVMMKICYCPSFQASSVSRAVDFPWCWRYTSACWRPIKAFNCRCEYASVWFSLVH